MLSAGLITINTADGNSQFFAGFEAPQFQRRGVTAITEPFPSAVLARLPTIEPSGCQFKHLRRQVRR